MTKSNNKYEISVADSNINISNGDVAFTMHCSKDFDSFYVIVFKIKNKSILCVDYDIDDNDYEIYYNKDGITGYADNPADYINRALQSYPDLVDLLGECQTGTHELLTFSNLQKLANIN